MRQSDLKHAIATGDIKTLKRSAHSVGGLLRTFQPNSEPGSAMDIAHQLEHVADGSDTAIMEKLYSQLCESLESVVAELKASQSR